MTNGTPLTFPLIVPAIRITQPLGDFFVAALSARLLLKTCFSNSLRMIADESADGYTAEGTQRDRNEKRAESISRYIKTTEAAFPNTIILAANYDKSGELVDDEDMRWSFAAKKDAACGMLTIPSDKELASIVDGQHRLAGFASLLNGDRVDMLLPCSIYLDLPIAYQAQLFATINYHQKPVNKNVTYQLYGYNLDEEPPEAWSPEKAAVFICRKLSFETESPFKDHIVLTAQRDEHVGNLARERGTEWAVSTATVVEGILKLISSNPVEDRDLMHEHRLNAGRRRKVLENAVRVDASPLRQAYLSSNDLLIFTVVKNFFAAVEKVMWRKASPYSYIRKTVGIQACFDVLKKLVLQMLEEKDIRIEAFAAHIAPLKHLDFADNFFQASGKGRQRIRMAMELCLKLATVNDIRNEADVADYKRLCGTA